MHFRASSQRKIVGIWESESWKKGRRCWRPSRCFWNHTVYGEADSSHSRKASLLSTLCLPSHFSSFPKNGLFWMLSEFPLKYLFSAELSAQPPCLRLGSKDPYPHREAELTWLGPVCVHSACLWQPPWFSKHGLISLKQKADTWHENWTSFSRKGILGQPGEQVSKCDSVFWQLRAAVTWQGAYQTWVLRATLSGGAVGAQAHSLWAWISPLLSESKCLQPRIWNNRILESSPTGYERFRN